jgi:hypothetical protein
MDALPVRHSPWTWLMNHPFKVGEGNLWAAFGNVVFWIGLLLVVAWYWRRRR